MLQRNPGTLPLDVPAIPATVPPGGTVDWPHPVTGLEPAGQPAPDPEPSAPDTAEGPAPGADPKPTTKSRKAASPAAPAKEAQP